MKIVISILSLLLSFTALNAQATASADKAKIKALNTYVDFVNESIHGMLIIHRLLENYNQDINKYVDLEGSQINFYSNADIPFNIFEDPDHWFYSAESPSELKDIILTRNAKLGPITTELNKSVLKITEITTKVNDLRFTVEATILNNDLKKLANLAMVYKDLEKGVSLYEEMYEETKTIQDLIRKVYRGIGKKLQKGKEKALYGHMQMLHRSTWNILVALREKKEGLFDQLLIDHSAAGNKFDKMVGAFPGKKEQRVIKNIKKAYSESYESTKRFHEYADVDKEYKLYGKYYFYHNSDIINKFNRYGSGYVFEMNTWLSKMSEAYLKFLEMPHYYKVIYPKKLVKVDKIVSSDSNIELIPRKLKDREIVSADIKMYVDTAIVDLHIFDHLIEDDDIVSINFNGDWIIESYSLEWKPVDVKIQLNKKGKNFLILHSESEGKKPLSTLGISYNYKGKKEKIRINSTTNKSEMIEIILEE